MSDGYHLRSEAELSSMIGPGVGAVMLLGNYHCFEFHLPLLDNIILPRREVNNE